MDWKKIAYEYDRACDLLQKCQDAMTEGMYAGVPRDTQKKWHDQHKQVIAELGSFNGFSDKGKAMRAGKTPDQVFSMLNGLITKEIGGFMQEINADIKAHTQGQQQPAQTSRPTTNPTPGQKFAEQYAKMRQFCEKNNLALFIHGTSGQDALNSITENGLQCKMADLSHTSVSYGSKADNVAAELEAMKNWKHLDAKQFVFIGVPLEASFNMHYGSQLKAHNDEDKALDYAMKATKPIWKENDSHYSLKATLPPEFILATGNLETGELKRNDKFSIMHTYEGLSYDISLVPPSIHTEMEAMAKTNQVEKDLVRENADGVFVTETGKVMHPEAPLGIYKTDDGRVLQLSKEDNAFRLRDTNSGKVLSSSEKPPIITNNNSFIMDGTGSFKVSDFNPEVNGMSALKMSIENRTAYSEVMASGLAKASDSFYKIAHNMQKTQPTKGAL